MTQYEKELLLKDLCGRLPYGVKCQFQRDGYTYDGILCGIEEVIDSNGHILEFIETMSGTCCQYYLSNIKPYLFPLSSMTEEQMKELEELCDMYTPDDDYTFNLKINVIDWLNKNHFDYRGLIEKGLAIDATSLNIY